MLCRIWSTIDEFCFVCFLRRILVSVVGIEHTYCLLVSIEKRDFICQICCGDVKSYCYCDIRPFIPLFFHDITNLVFEGREQRIPCCRGARLAEWQPLLRRKSALKNVMHRSLLNFSCFRYVDDEVTTRSKTDLFPIATTMESTITLRTPMTTTMTKRNNTFSLPFVIVVVVIGVRSERV